MEIRKTVAWKPLSMVFRSEFGIEMDVHLQLEPCQRVDRLRARLKDEWIEARIETRPPTSSSPVFGLYSEGIHWVRIHVAGIPRQSEFTVEIETSERLSLENRLVGGEIGESLWLARGIGIVRWMSDTTPTPLELVPP
jgi:hypothetical protein